MAALSSITPSIGRETPTSVSGASKNFSLDTIKIMMSFIPSDIHHLARVSKSWELASKGVEWIQSYFYDLSRCSSEASRALIGEINYKDPNISPRRQLNTLIQNLYKRALLIWNGRDKIAELQKLYKLNPILGDQMEEPYSVPPYVGVVPPFQLANIARWIQKEEDRTLVTLAPQFFPAPVWADIQAKNRMENPTASQSVLAQKVREKIRGMTYRERDRVKVLDVSAKSVTTLPSEIFVFTSIETIRELQFSRIPALPYAFKNFTSLIDYGMAHRHLITVPDDGMRMKSGEWLERRKGTLKVIENNGVPIRICL